MIKKSASASPRVRDRLRSSEPSSRPRISKPLVRLFGKYSEGFVRRNFHSLRLLERAQPSIPREMPVVLYLNHASWWDPLVCLLLARRFLSGRASYAPIEAEALRRYRFFQRLGFFGVKTGSARGAADFLKTTHAILANETSALWLTPQGEFADPRARPLNFQRGLSHLTTQLSGPTAFVPLALEYTFWEERSPEILIGFGAPVIFDSSKRLNVFEATQLFELALESVQDQLAAAAQRRQPDEWKAILQGGLGTHRVYDWWRRASAMFRGEPFSSAHSDL